LEKNGIIGMEGGKKIVLIGKGPVHIVEEGPTESDDEDDRQLQAERDKWQA
jgi:hypothetical protein